MEIRQAFPNEIGAIMTVIESARTALAEAGSTQWQGADGYPTEETIFDDYTLEIFFLVLYCIKY